MATHSNGETIKASHINEKFDTANVDTDTSLAANSDSKVASQKATKSYVDTKDSTNVKTSGDQTLQGVKTFGSIPVLPASNPTTDNQAVRKAYVDATAMTGVKFGSTTHDAATAETQNIAHGCGKTPKLVKIIARWLDWDDYKQLNELETNGTGGLIKRTRPLSDYTRFELVASASSVPQLVFDDYSTPVGVVSLNSTNISIAWTAQHSPTGTVYIYWEAIY